MSAAVRVLRAADRNHTDQPGITTWHCFSSGSHYDPDNLAFGPLIACDEHGVSAGAGFARHRHAGVAIVSWPLNGTLHHESDDGQLTEILPGTAQVLLAGPGVSHAESAGADEGVRFVQLVLLSDLGEAGAYRVVPVDPDRPVRDAVAPLATIRTPGGPAAVSAVRASPRAIRWEAGARRFVYVASGNPTLIMRTDGSLLDDTVELSPGDTVRIGASIEAELVAEPGPADLLVVTLPD